MKTTLTKALKKVLLIGYSVIKLLRFLGVLSNKTVAN